MNEKLTCSEEQEEAVFYFLMDGLARNESEQIEEEERRLRESGRIAVPRRLNRRMRRFISRTAERLYRERAAAVPAVRAAPVRVHHVRRPFKMALVTACLIIALSASATAKSGLLWSFMVTEGENGTNIEMSYNGDERELDSPTDSLVTDFNVTYVPDGYFFASKTITVMNIMYEFLSTNDETIRITKMSPDAGGSTLYNDGYDITYETINGYEAMVSEDNKEKVVMIIWSDDVDMSFYRVISEGIDRNETIKVASGLENVA